MISYKRDGYELLLSDNPCEIFHYYNTKEMHGLNLKDCNDFNNNSENAYFAGWCNYVPKKDKAQDIEETKFLYLNLNRCGPTDIDTFGLIMHELMHQSFDRFNEDISMEEDIITWAELESYEVFKIVKKHLKS